MGLKGFGAVAIMLGFLTFLFGSMCFGSLVIIFGIIMVIIEEEQK